MRTGCLAVLCVCFLAAASGGANGEERPEPLPFGVVNQRSIALMAAYWNPILEYVSRTSAVPLKLGMGKTSEETTRMMVHGDFAFVFTNRLFTPARVSLGYRVIARPDSPGVQGNVVVRGGSPIRSLEDLAGKTVAFPSREAFFGYFLPMDAMLRAKIAVQPVFAGTQEGALAQLEAGRVDAAAVNGSIMHGYARRMKLEFRVIWESAVYPDHCIMAAPKVPRDAVAAVRNAFIGMSASREGRAVLASVAEGLGMAGPLAFVKASDAEYEPYRRFYKSTLVRK